MPICQVLSGIQIKDSQFLFQILMKQDVIIMVEGLDGTVGAVETAINDSIQCFKLTTAGFS